MGGEIRIAFIFKKRINESKLIGFIIIKETERDFACGGSIINDRYILTAAHCITKLQKAVLAGIRVGEHDISSDKDCITPDFCAPAVQDIYIEKVIPHPGYIGLTEKGLNLEHDIGLLRLEDPIDLTKGKKHSRSQIH